MSPSKIDYRGPAGPDELVRHQAHEQILRREGLFWVKIAGMLAAGVPLSFVGPAAAASMVWTLQHRYHGQMSWGLLFVLASCIVLPILYLIEWRTAGDFFMQELRAQNPGDLLSDPPASRGEWQLRTAAVESAVWIEILLFAPRLVMGAMRQWRARVAFKDISRHRAAELVVMLVAADGGVDVQRLMREDELPQQLRQVLDYLRFYDWIDLGDKGRRVWLLTAARKALGG